MSRSRSPSPCCQQSPIQLAKEGYRHTLAVEPHIQAAVLAAQLDLFLDHPQYRSPIRQIAYHIDNATLHCDVRLLHRFTNATTFLLDFNASSIPLNPLLQTLSVLPTLTRLILHTTTGLRLEAASMSLKTRLPLLKSLEYGSYDARHEGIYHFLNGDNTNLDSLFVIVEVQDDGYYRRLPWTSPKHLQLHDTYGPLPAADQLAASLQAAANATDV
ncbi:hypothetical protein JCM11641_006954 [Rhodosporidiobolus odoratus]